MAAIVSLVLAISARSQATVISPTFSGPALDSGFTEVGNAGTSYTVGGGTLTLSMAPGTRSGDTLVGVSTTAPIAGDFVVTVTAIGVGLGRADLGALVGNVDFSNAIADDFLNGTSGTVNGNIFLPKFSGAPVSSALSSVQLTIERFGDEITDLYNSGMGPVIINSGNNAALAAPSNVSLFLLEAGEVGDQNLHFGSFTHLEIATGDDADALIPEPASAALLYPLLSLVLLLATRRGVGRATRHPCPVR